jgi:primosomal protein N' (replication factor Y)
MIAKIAVSAATFAIDKPYSYWIPEGMEPQVGIRVMIPFGKGNKRTEGIILALEEGSADGLKSVDRLLDDAPMVSREMLKLAAFLRERYFCTFYDAIRTMLPAGIWFRTSDTYRLTEDLSWQEKEIRQPNALKLLQFLLDCGGEAPDRLLAGVVEDEAEREKALKYLAQKKWIADETQFSRKLGDKTEKIVTLAAPVEEVMEYASHSMRAPMQRSVLELMCGIGSVSQKELCYFTGAKPATVKRLVALGYLELSDKPVLRCSEIKPVKLEGPLELNDEQSRAFDGLHSQMRSEQPGVALLYGVTGSGKTSVYIRLIQSCLDDGKSAMLLVPEIALTPQLLSLLAAYFGDKIAVLHSSLAAGERYDQWKRVRSGDARVVIGTRSAVFAPCKNLGLIILDEEQEHSYKSENAPRYAAKEVAIWRGAKEKALIVLGSATPSVETMYHAKNGDYQLYTLKSRYGDKPLPNVQIVDMSEEIKNGNDLVFCYDLLDAIHDTANAKKQTILFLNRRGNSRALACVDCGETPECPRCNARLTYHSANERLMCHYCGFSQSAPQRCPTCGGPLKRIGTGTQKAQEELAQVMPEIEIARMDSDTVNAVNTHQKILDDFTDKGIPVLIGTQMVAKGLNLPDVTLVGVLDADMSLYSGSYRAAENTFNMLTQVVGRAGRGDTPGRAVIQTMVPKHKVLELAAKQDYDGFYDMEIEMRRIQGCPPFGDLAAITFVGQEEARVLRGAAKFRDSLNVCLKMPEYAQENATVLGPAPCAVPKINYNFRYRLTLKCKMTRPLRQLLAHMLRQFAKDGANRGVSAFADINGFEE